MFALPTVDGNLIVMDNKKLNESGTRCPPHIEENYER
ncbi:MAG: hypothetical protein ACJAQ6_002164 [Arenicella sp.]|jgi:hypothetical protein